MSLPVNSTRGTRKARLTYNLSALRDIQRFLCNVLHFIVIPAYAGMRK
jgi:hypothetical protein